MKLKPSVVFLILFTWQTSGLRAADRNRLLPPAAPARARVPGPARRPGPGAPPAARGSAPDAVRQGAAAQPQRPDGSRGGQHTGNVYGSPNLGALPVRGGIAQGGYPFAPYAHLLGGTGAYQYPQFRAYAPKAYAPQYAQFGAGAYSP